MEELTKLLEVLAQQLGTTTEYLWTVLIKQAMFAGITDIIFTLVVIVITVFFFKWIKWSRNNWKDKYYYNDLEPLFYTGLVIGSIALFVCYMIIFIGLHVTLAAFFNPEYWALNRILGLVGSH